MTDAKPRRELLRRMTEQEHRRLDEAVGRLDDRGSDVADLGGLHGFRETIEKNMKSIAWPGRFGRWRPVVIAAAETTSRHAHDAGAICRQC